MKPHITWILVADGERARVLQNLGPGKGLSAAMNGEFFQNLSPSRALGTDRPGRAFESASVARHAYEPRTDFHRAQKQTLCKQMAEMLNRGAREKSYERLVLVVPPQILGELRQFLDDHAKNRIIGEVKKDFTHLAIHDLPKHLDGVVVL
jgi:protein required for attachment to host cells